MAKVVVGFAATALALAAAEVGVRLFAPQQLIELDPRIWIPDDGLGWRHAPGLRTRVNTGDATVDFATDGWGHRIGPEPMGAVGVRLLALGDSFVEGLQVGFEDTMTERLRSILERDLGVGVEVVNAGVGGWDPNHYLIAARREITRARYRCAIVFLYAGNDIVFGRVDHFPPRERVQAPVGLSGRVRLRAWLYPVNEVLERRSHLFVLVRQRAALPLMRLGLSSKYFPSVCLRSERDSTRWRTTASICADLAGELDRAGVPVLFVLLPGVTQVEPSLARRYAWAARLPEGEIDLEQPSRALASELRADGMDLIDLLPALRQARGAGRGPLYGLVDTHLAADGHRVVAETVAPRVEELLTPSAPSGRGGGWHQQGR